MLLELHDVVGLLGAITVLITYFLLQTHKMSAYGFSYSAFNLLGAIFIMYSLTQSWNLTSFFIEIIWGGISVYGLIRWYREKVLETKDQKNTSRRI